MQTREIRDIGISAIVLAFVFSYEGLNIGLFMRMFPMALVAVSAGFLLHELAHRFAARRFGSRAEFKMWQQGVILAVAMAVITQAIGTKFIFAAPGAVMIYPRMDIWGNITHLSRKNYGLVALAGPVMNILLAGIFAVANVFFPMELFTFAIFINIWLAFFNLIPMWILDGAKIFAWNWRIWAAVFVFVAALFMLI